MNIQLINRGTEGELRISGRLDTNTSADAEKIFLDVSERFDQVILDMEKLEYVSSAGLRALRRVQLAVRRRGGSLLIRNVTPAVMELFEITGFAAIAKFI